MRRPGCSCAERSSETAISTCPLCCTAAIRSFLSPGVDNRELFAEVDSRVSVSGVGEGEGCVEALSRWFKAEGLDPLVF